MKIADALRITQSAAADALPFKVIVACGFTPLHFQTLLTAYVQQAVPGRKVQVTTGLYGGLIDLLESIAEPLPDALAVALEWPDLDPRLDYRSAGAWDLNAADDVVSSVRARLSRLQAALNGLPAGFPAALCLPTLPLPPLFHTPGWQASEHELSLHAAAFEFAADLARKGRVRVLSSQRLAESSPASSRFNLKSDLQTGLPHTLEHADRVAHQLCLALLPPAPKKGIITDLDDTLWRGIVGEVGAENVTWSMEDHSQLHALYQKLLASLAQSGTLVAVASKNDPAVVEQAFQRKDLLLSPQQIFPIEVHWNAKSASVKRILTTWNIAADSAIFVDDSPLELAEVAAGNPGIDCILFPKDDPAAGLQMLWKLRDACGKQAVLADDGLRLESIRQGAAFLQQAASTATPEEFLKDAKSSVTLDFGSANEPRVLELVNKTNQFNLNGRRYTESDWKNLAAQHNATIIAVAYQDRFGPLGTIAVLGGVTIARRFVVEAWVMSCRAFGRRIEYQVLNTLFEQTGCAEIEFDLKTTPKNKPIRDFLATLTGDEPDGRFTLTRLQFVARCPALYHEVHELRRMEAHG